ncbi:MAG: hypothetical protein ACI4EC_00845 [Lachnospiraceae bacterium]
MSTPMIVLLVTLAVLIIVMVVLYFLGKRMQKKKEEQDAQMAAVAQTIPLLVIDKRKMKLSESGLPQAVLDQTPKMMRRSKMPVVKAKVGPKVTTFLCDAEIFEQIPVKQQIKATVSGLYITGIKGMRGPLETVPRKKGFMAKIREKAGM